MKTEMGSQLASKRVWNMNANDNMKSKCALIFRKRCQYHKKAPKDICRTLFIFLQFILFNACTCQCVSS